MPRSGKHKDSETEIGDGVVVADACHDPLQQPFVVRVFAVFHPVTDEIAQDAAEIFVARIGDEAPGIRKHAYKSGEKAHTCQRCKLLFHSFAVVVEPPGAALLDSASAGTALETAHDGADGGVVVGIQGIKDRFRKGARSVHGV